MSDTILRVAAHSLQPVLLLASLMILLGGHDAPGGGFAGGLIAACAYALHALAHDVPSARRLLRITPQHCLVLGLLMACVSACLGLWTGDPFMAGQWGAVAGWEVGSPLLFEVGVYLVVLGATLSMLWSMQEAD